MKNTVTGQIKQQVSTKILDQKEWNFKNVPDREIEACYLYEYAREFSKTNGHLQKFQKVWNDPAKEQSGDTYEALDQARDLLRTHCEIFRASTTNTSRKSRGKIWLFGQNEREKHCKKIYAKSLQMK